MSGIAPFIEIFTGNDPFDSSRISLNNGLQQGDFFIGPAVNFVNHSLRNITEYIAKREDSDEYVIFKVLHCAHDGEMNNGHQSQGKALLHNEHLILSLLQDQPRVIHQHGLFKFRNKFILVLDCLMPHEYDKKGLYKHFINLQQYVIQKKRLQEKEALEIFCNILVTLKSLHQNNIVHRDLKLGNMVYNKWNKDVTLINFALSKHLVRDNDLLTDQRGSLAYVSPDVLSGNPYDGKASDMWAMGVLLYTMVFGRFPFYDDDPQELFKKIRSANFIIPSTTSQGKLDQTFDLIKMLIQKHPQKRLTVEQALDMAQTQLSLMSDVQDFKVQVSQIQVVPDSGEGNDLTDCIVPDSKSKLENTVGYAGLASSHITASISIDSFSFQSTDVSSQSDAVVSEHHDSRNPFLNATSSLNPIPAQNFPPLTCHHYPLAITLSSDSYLRLNQTSPYNTTTYSNSSSVQSVSDSGNLDDSVQGVNLPTLTRSSDQLNILSQSQSSLIGQTQRKRRNSGGSESRIRRHSAAPFRTVASITNVHRQRRRSHDARDEQGDLLERLHIAATRRRSLSAPFQNSVRTQNSKVINHHNN